MGLSIENVAVEAKVRRLAEITGLGVTEAVDLAVSEKLASAEGGMQARPHAAMEEVWRKYGPLMPLDQDAIVLEMYDDQGMAR